MKYSTYIGRRASVAISILLVVGLCIGVIPLSAFAETALNVQVESPKQISETAHIADTRPAQVGGEVALAAGTTTVLDKGLVFVIDNTTNTAALTGWYGTQPAENLTIPAEIRHNGKVSAVNTLGAHGSILGSEDSTKKAPASTQPSATGQEGTLAQLPKLTSVSIPESITAITSDTFTDCPQLATITVAQNNPTYASVDGLLYNKALTRILLFPGGTEGVVTLPDQTDAIPASAPSQCANLNTLLVGQSNAVFSTINGSLYSKDATTLIACPGGIGETLTLPKQTTTIGPDALAGITTLKSIVVLGNITTIDPTAFNDQAKQSTTIALPGGEDYETRKAVWEQAGFKNFATPANPGDTQTPDQPGEGTQPGQPGNNPTDPSKPASGFSYKLLEDYTLEASWTGELSPESNPIIPATAQLAGLSYTVSALAPRAFAGTALTAIDIPTTITTIGDQAFANCPNLTRIITHTNTLTVAPTALEACTNLEVWCPYNESETYPWSIGLFATNNHIKAYGLPASQQPLTLEVGQSANLFEPGTLQAPDPSKTIYAYEATCLSVSQEGTITAKAPGTTTISTSIELEEIPLTHTTRTISVVAPTPPTTPEQPETPTPTPPITQPITPRYPPNLATPTQASAPLYSRGGIQPRAYVPTVDVTLPLEPTNISINAVGDQTTAPVNITSNTPEPIRATSITTTENADPATGAPKLIADPTQRAKTKVTVAKNPNDPATKASMTLSPSGTWPADPANPDLFRVNPGTPLPVTFGLDFPSDVALSYVSDSATTPVSLASVAFTFGLLDPVAKSVSLSSSVAITAPKVGDTLTAAYTGLVSGVSATYTWFALAPQDATPTSGNVIKGANSSSFQLTPNEIDKYVCCAVSDGAFTTPANWKNRPVYSDVTAPVAAALPDYATLEAYSWAELSQVADYLSKHKEDTGNTVYDNLKTKFEGFMNYNPNNIPATDPRAPEIGMKKRLSLDDPYTAASLPEVRIVGINHDVKSDGSGTAGLTFMATHSLPKAYQMNSSGLNTGGWKGSQLYPKMQTGGEIWNTLPDDLKATGIIKPVKKLTNNVNGTVGGIAVEPTSDYLWLPSYKELVGNTKYPNWQTVGPWIDYEGSQYEFFTTRVTNNGGANTILDGMDKTQDGVNSPEGLNPANYTHWWERSCFPGNPGNFVICDANGTPSYNGIAYRSLGVVPGFSL